MEDRLLDHDDKVRVAVVKAFCDLAISDLKSVPTDVLTKVAECLRDKKVHYQDQYFLSFNVLCCFDTQSLYDAEAICYKSLL